MAEKNSILSKLRNQHCKTIKAGSKGLGADKVTGYLKALPGWKRSDGQIYKTYSFENYYQTMAFVNALAWVSHEQDHHPDLEVGYNQSTVHYSTHSVGGLSENDFICAAKADSLLNI